MRPRLCLFTDSFEPSGVGEHMLALAAELQGDYFISFVCRPTPQGLPTLQRAAAMGLETLAIEARGRPGREKLRQWLCSWRPEIFHGHAGIGWEGLGGICVARRVGVPTVLRTEHLPYLITDKPKQALHKSVMQYLDRLICVSEQARLSFLEAGLPEEKLRTVRNGIPLRAIKTDRPGVRARLGLDPSCQVVLTVGRFAEQKGYRYLVEAVPLVLEHLPDARFVWVGTGRLEQELRRRVEHLGLGASVTFAGRCHDVSQLMAAADLFVLPSLFEGLPLTVLEAMAAGLPVVATAGCGAAEAVVDGKTGRIVEPANVAQLASTIVEILKQPDLAARWGTAGRLRVEREFSASRMAQETAAVYDELSAGMQLTRGQHRHISLVH